MAKVYIYPNREKASLFVRQMLVAIWPEIKMLGFATGGTPKLVYGFLVQAYQDGKISFKDIYIVNLDEYVGLDQDHPQSYAKYLKDIYCQLDIDMRKNRFPTCLVDMASEIQNTCLRMEEWIEKHGPVTVWILGIGENAHFAFLEPDRTERIKDGKARYHVVELSLSTKKINQVDFDKAITAGLLTVKEGKYLIQLAFGPQKTWAVSASVLGLMTGWIPSSLLQKHPNWILVVDEDAGKGLLEYLSKKKPQPKEGSDGERFYEVVSEAGITHQVFISRDGDLAGRYSIPTRTLAEETADLR